MSDLIDRQKAIRNICNEDCHQPTPCKWKCIAIEELEALPSVETEPEWIPVSERLPEEHDSIFSKFYGTEKWRDAMFRKTSKTVIITVEHLDGTRQTAPCHTIDGEWNQSMKGMGKVLAWMPLPEPWGGDSYEVD